MTLHEAIVVVLKEAGRPLTRKDIADKINARKLYIRGDGKPLPSNQIGARVSHYLNLFTVNPDGSIALNDDKAPIKKEKNDYTDREKPVFDFDAMIKGFTKPSNRPETKMEDIKFRTIEDLKKAGFEGFFKVKDLKENFPTIPGIMGVYMVVRNSSDQPAFLKIGSGGFFKGEDPNVPIDELKRNWVADTCVVYIGKASSLRKRLYQYLRFGSGKNVGHKGGRYIWQLKDHDDLLFCWKILKDKDPEQYESELIETFRSIYGERPFANLAK